MGETGPFLSTHPHLALAQDALRRHGGWVVVWVNGSLHLSMRSRKPAWAKPTPSGSQNLKSWRCEGRSSKERPRHTSRSHVPATEPSGKCSLRLRRYRGEAGGLRAEAGPPPSRDASCRADPDEPTLRIPARPGPWPRLLSCGAGPLSSRVSRVSVHPPAGAAPEAGWARESRS